MKIQEYQAIATVIEGMYLEMDKENDLFSQSSGISCVSTCGGVCCQNKAVAVPPSDLLPLALQIIEEDRVEEILQQLDSVQDQACMFYKMGKCTIYSKRSTLCRLFAFSSVYNKQGAKVLSLCSYIKEGVDINVNQDQIDQAANIVDWSSSVSSLIPSWDSKCLPFNQALKYALEKVLLSHQYEGV